MKPVLQSRWAVEGKHLVYYGLREQPDTFKNKVRISHRTVAFLSTLDGERDLEEYTEHKNNPAIKKHIAKKIIFDGK